MTQPPEDGAQRRARPGRRPVRVLAGIVVSLIVAVAGGLALALAWISLAEEPIRLPGWMAARIEARLEAALAPGAVSLDRISIAVDDAIPRLRLGGLSVEDATGRPIAQVPDVTLWLAPGALLRGRFALRRLAADGAELTLRRDADGRLALALGRRSVPIGAGAGIGDVLAQIETAFARAPLSSVGSLTAENVTLNYSDARTGRRWQAEGGLLAITRQPDALSAQIFATLNGAGGPPAELAITASSSLQSRAATLSVSFSDVPAGDIAAQSPALSALAVLNAPISGAMRTGMTDDGGLAPLAATLEIGAGSVQPTPEAAPIDFNAANVYLRYRPAERRVTLDEVRVSGPHVALRASGQALLTAFSAGWPREFVFQMTLSDMRLAPSGMFLDPVTFPGGSADFKLALDPFTLRLGQAVVTDPDGNDYRLSGAVSVGEGGWRGRADLGADRLGRDRLLDLWPVGLATGARRWVGENVLAGTLRNLNGALRLSQGAPAVTGLSFEIAAARVRVMPDLPPAAGLTGYGALSGERFSVTATGGRILAAGGRGAVNLAGSSFTVPDIAARPATGEVALAAAGPVPAALALLDRPPFRLMEKAGRSPDLARGEARVSGGITLPLKPGLTAGDVGFSLSGQLRDVASETLVPGRRLTADRLDLSADPGEVSISGTARLDGIRLAGRWRRPLGPEAEGAPSTVEATVEITPRALAALDVRLPEGSLNGSGRGTLSLELPEGASPRFRVTSDLRGLGLSLPGTGWTKPAGASGRFEIAGRLARPPRITAMTLEAPGLSVSDASITLTEAGGLREARLGRVRIGGWLDAPVVIEGRGEGLAPAIALTGGRVDLRERPAGSGGAGGGGPIRLALDRLIVSESISLTGLSGRLDAGGGLSGSLSGRIGPAEVTLVLSPATRGTRIDARSDDAGGVLKGAGIFPDAGGGRLTLTLVPRAAPGGYEGTVRIRDVRVRNAPTLAQLLNAISVVGLLDSLTGEGLFFSEAGGDFRLGEGRLEIIDGRAVGPSLGISLNGTVNLDSGALDLEGVVSPVYALNVVGRVFSRPGEGLFGFNYSLSGTTDNPKVGVNPMSIIAPGILRELFRAR